jgi:cytochrome bd-type quinol oxidase subunit 2
MMRFTAKQMLLVTLVIAFVLAVATYFWRNLSKYNAQIGWMCIIAIPIMPFATPVLAYVLTRKHKLGTRTLITFIGLATGIGISIACYFLLGHIVREYWAG